MLKGVLFIERTYIHSRRPPAPLSLSAARDLVDRVSREPVTDTLGSVTVSLVRRACVCVERRDTVACTTQFVPRRAVPFEAGVQRTERTRPCSKLR